MTSTFFALRRGAILAITFLLAMALVACSSPDEGGGETSAAETSGESGSGTATVESGAVEISADSLAFSAQTIEAPAGEAFTITLVNNDTVPHNISIYTEEGGDEIVVGDVINGGETVEVEVSALDAGEYFFVCDLHPEMTGTVSVG